MFTVLRRPCFIDIRHSFISFSNDIMLQVIVADKLAAHNEKLVHWLTESFFGYNFYVNQCEQRLSS